MIDMAIFKEGLLQTFYAIDVLFGNMGLFFWPDWWNGPWILCLLYAILGHFGAVLGRLWPLQAGLSAL